MLVARLQAKASIGSPLVIEGEEYDDLDEVIYRFIHPFVDHARELVVRCCFHTRHHRRVHFAQACAPLTASVYSRRRTASSLI